MKKINKKIFILITLFFIIFSMTCILFNYSKKTNIINSVDGSTPSHYLSNASFIEDTTIFTDREVEWEFINKYYSELPKTENETNFHSLATSRFDNINGQTVTVDTFYREYKGTLNDPNYAMGTLLFQSMLYKSKYPEKDVSVYFSSFRVSVSAAVCLNPNSPYYGYMRSLYDCDYDSNGFVRISYLFVEAAKMGINVNIVGHLNANPASQYNNDTGKTNWKTEPGYENYFNKAMNYSCYSKYANGKKVKDFFTLKSIKWTHADKTYTDVMHTKILAVSNYLDKYGNDHGESIWLSSENLDAYDYRAYNGNGRSQTGLIISDHAGLYQVASNYLTLVGQYSQQENVQKLRKVIRDKNIEQIRLISEDKEDLIPKNEKIVYLGSEEDEVFELYFTPFGGDIDSWDLDNNPYCKYFQELYDSTEYVELCWNNPNFLEDFFVCKTMIKGIEEKFITNSIPGNRLSLSCENATFTNLMGLTANENLDFAYVNNQWDKVHEKDLLMSYVKNDERQYVTLHNSCNFNDGALYYQINFALVIKETESTGNVIYKSLGDAISRGSIVDDGQTFSDNERWQVEEKLTDLPRTFETEFILNSSEVDVDSYGILFSNSDFYNNSITYVINKNGNPEVILGMPVENSKGIKNYKRYKFTFNNVNVVDGKKTHLAITIDDSSNQMKCYINGTLKQTLSNISYLENNFVTSNVFVVGGDHLGSNHEYFMGTMYELYAWSDVRTATEIKSDYTSSTSSSDANLLAGFIFSEKTRNTYTDDISVNDNDCEIIRLWLDESEVNEIDDFDYSFAVVGDTQALAYYHPEGIDKTYQWLVDNKEEHKIEYVFGVGDITELSNDDEWELVSSGIYKLDGNIRYSVVMGNHDKWDLPANNYSPNDRSQFKFNQYFYTDKYLDELDGWYGEGDVSCSYNAFEVNGNKWLLINLDYGPTDEMLDWASNIVEEYSDYKVIVITHAYLYRDGTTLDSTECYPASKDNSTFNDGDGIWDKFVSKYENIKLVISGHDPWDHIVCTQTENVNSNVVTQLLVDGQYMDKYYGETDMVALLYFSNDGKKMSVRYYSINKEMYGSQLSQFDVILD